MLVFIVAIALWVITQYGTASCSIIIEKYRVVENYEGSEARIQVLFRFVKPERLASQEFDIALAEVPVGLLRDDLQSGNEIHFQYQEKPLWLGVGKYTFYENPVENPFNLFWDRLLNVENKQLNAKTKKLLDGLYDSME